MIPRTKPREPSTSEAMIPGVWKKTDVISLGAVGSKSGQFPFVSASSYRCRCLYLLNLTVLTMKSARYAREINSESVILALQPGLSTQIRDQKGWW